MAIIDEPVRGRTPPPWFLSLPGIERVRAVSRGLIPRTPLARLLGIRTTHVAAGTATLAIPAGESCVGGNGQIEVSAFAAPVLEAATTTAIDAGAEALPLVVTFEPLRPAWPGPGNLIARARVLDSGNLFVLAEMYMEDADGRHLGRAGMRSVIRKVEPPPPLPPSTIGPVEEPVYETPDPYLRRSRSGPPADALSGVGGPEIVQKIASGEIVNPVGRLFGYRLESVEVGKVVMSLVASEWFCDVRGELSGGPLMVLASQCTTIAAYTLAEAGVTPVPIEGMVDFFGAVRPDGRRLQAEGTATRITSDHLRVVTQIRDADGNVVVIATQSFALVGADRRARRKTAKSTRVLATLLFTDIVDSTALADRMGDAAWQELLDQHKTAVRQEVSRHNGTEVDTAGDGVFARFDSPARAIEAARAARSATESLGVRLRAGIHTGECELVGTRLAGIAVHVAARIQATAAPGEILVSSTVKELTTGSHVAFTDRGTHELKGVPDPWRLYAVTA